MRVLLLLFSFIIVVLILILIHLQRQISDICRQLHFLKEHDSNMKISTDIQSGKLGRLTEVLNELLDTYRKKHQKYLEKEQTISDMYTNLSHDIRTPLTSLDGYFQLLENNPDPKEQKYYISIIQERITSLKDMLEELFTFTRLKSDSYKLKMELCDLNRVLKNTLLSYYENWIGNGITPVFELPEHPLFIKGDILALKHIIQNIIKNGIDHGEKQLSISLKNADSHAILIFKNEVQDPSQIDVSQVFERFYKADEARSRNSTGLGLSIAKELVLRMKGSIRASTDKNWFCIEIRFPLVQNPDTTTPRL